MRRAACPGSFDPVTNGHIDIISRASTLFDEVVVAVGVNASKKRLFTVEERIEMLAEAIAPYANVRIDSFDGLLADFCSEHDVQAIVKGLRAVSDFDYELQMAQMNSSLVRHRDGLRADQPGVLLPRLQPGQGGRPLRRRRLRAGAARTSSPGSPPASRSLVKTGTCDRRLFAVPSWEGLRSTSSGVGSHRARLPWMAGAPSMRWEKGTTWTCTRSSPRLRRGGRAGAVDADVGLGRRQPRRAARADRRGVRRARGSLHGVPAGDLRARRRRRRGSQQAEQIVAEAHSEREKIISDTDVYRVAKREADQLLEQARAEADELRKETDDYVDAKLANFEITLERTTEAVKRGRERLAGRSAFDALTSDEVDKIKLPEHLDN